jgi:hypothetical protein
VRYQVERGVLAIRLDGVPDADTFIALLDRIVGDLSVPRGAPCLIDVRQVNGGPSRAELERVVAFFDEHGDVFSRRRAVLVATTLQYGLARIAAVLESFRGVDVGVFRAEDAAVAWLLRPGRAAE